MLKTLTIYLISWHRKTQKVILQLGSKLHQKRHRSLYRIALVLLGDKTLLAFAGFVPGSCTFVLFVCKKPTRLGLLLATHTIFVF